MSNIPLKPCDLWLVILSTWQPQEFDYEKQWVHINCFIWLFQIKLNYYHRDCWHFSAGCINITLKKTEGHKLSKGWFSTLGCLFVHIYFLTGSTHGKEFSTKHAYCMTSLIPLVLIIYLWFREQEDKLGHVSPWF